MKHLALLLAFALPLAAQAAEDDGTCRNGLFTVDNPSPGLAMIRGKERAHFFEDMDGCPEAGARCRRKSYLIAGDKLVTGRSKGAWTCVFYPGGGGGSAGWMESNRLAAVPVNPAPPLSSWLGDWESDGARFVTFTRKSTGLAVKGTAFWPTRNPSPRDRPGGPNIGEIDGTARPQGNRLHEESCDVRFVLLGDWLVASDPTRDCDGMNVTFSGVYKRAAKGRR
jgi:hypothetical protein